ncbi:amino acid ABC transporter permease [Synechococcus sp. Nb3U1]|uniref:amino acid ABC transporter permease n=1 Tax=Synechococcus sp. Nb3U1 TaxID=1914529 RepID=UPI001F34670C|nr:amino acid ABC transporter permease [Synechococcus sp. Nb3U1]MCF2971202.1 amino acid ABC transporter permease [Synechococcus sp. Nb3U1]
MASSVSTPISEEHRLPPQEKLSPAAWVRRNLFDSWFSTVLTLVSALVLAWALSIFWNWAFTQANWAVIPANLKIFASGTYPSSQLWRVWVVLGIVLATLGVAAGAWGGVLLQYLIGLGACMGLAALLPLGEQSQWWLAGCAGVTFAAIAISRGRASWRLASILVWALVLPICLELLLGSFTPNLPGVRAEQLSGLLLTLMLAAAALIIAFPIGVLLALGRANHALPVVRIFCTLLIEIIRGVPLTTILFAAWLLVPFFLGGITVNLIIRAEVAFILFTAVYVAEDVRGGLQAVSRGQVEAARAVGLNPFQITALVVLPQALRASVPALVNEFLTLFKDTSLVFIIGMIDLLQAGRVVFTNPNWLGTQKEVLFFIGVVYFICCFAMAYAAKQVEKALGLGKR